MHLTYYTTIITYIIITIYFIDLTDLTYSFPFGPWNYEALSKIDVSSFYYWWAYSYRPILIRLKRTEARS